MEVSGGGKHFITVSQRKNLPTECALAHQPVYIYKYVDI